MDFFRFGLGFYFSFFRVMMGFSRGGVSNFLYYRRIVFKMSVVIFVRSLQILENLVSFQLMMNGVTFLFENGYFFQFGFFQLIRVLVDVLSKCKKVLFEYNVLVVEGVRKYVCKICCKIFLILTDCKKYIRVYTGEKFYVCFKCGKRFSQFSYLYKYSKTICLRWQSSNFFSILF